MGPLPGGAWRYRLRPGQALKLDVTRARDRRLLVRRDRAGRRAYLGDMTVKTVNSRLAGKYWVMECVPYDWRF
jgi:hypothetical protein